MNKIQMTEQASYFRAYFASFQLLECLHETHQMNNVKLLDVGGCHGIHARFFRSKGLDVDIVDEIQYEEPLTFRGDYFCYIPRRTYDVIWSSHVLEHVPNFMDFLRKMYLDLNNGGYLAVTVPPIRENRMAFEHLTFWNCGLLLLNASIAGFDTHTAHLAKYGYNVSLIIQKNESIQINYNYIITNWPKSMYYSERQFRGDIKRYHWSINKRAILTDPNFHEEIINKKLRLVYYDTFKNCKFLCC